MPRPNRPKAHPSTLPGMWKAGKDVRLPADESQQVSASDCYPISKPFYVDVDVTCRKCGRVET